MGQLIFYLRIGIVGRALPLFLINGTNANMFPRCLLTMLPILLDFGFIKIYATGALWGLAVLVAGITISRACFRRGYHPVWIWDLVAMTFLGGLIAARIGFFITTPGSLNEGFVEILKIWKGGLSLHWGVLGGFIIGYVYSRRQGIEFLHFADIWMPGLALGLAVSRFGCLLGGH